MDREPTRPPPFMESLFTLARKAMVVTSESAEQTGSEQIAVLKEC